MNIPVKPSQAVLKAFMIREEPVLLTGGQGITWRSGNTIIKPIDNEDETVWCAEVIYQLPQDNFRIARYKKSVDDTWVVNGWSAIEFIPGDQLVGHWEEKIDICNKFNNILINIPKPNFIDSRNHPWAVAGKMVWEELPLKYDSRLDEYVREVRKYMSPISVVEQIVHGDITGNMLFAPGLKPGIIDFTPVWRAKEYSLAILFIDAITWEGADRSILDLVRHEKDIFQYLLRAALFRTLVLSEFKRQRNIDRFDEFPQHERTLNIIVKNFT